MAKHKILMVDDDAILLQFVADFLYAQGYEVETARSGTEAIAKVEESPRAYSVVILDYQMHGVNGAQTCCSLLKINPSLFILIYSGDSSREAMLSTSRNGAKGFVDKGEGRDVFLAEIKKMCEKYEREVLTIVDNMDAGARGQLISTVGMVGRSAGLAELARVVTKLKAKPGPVLILGESGTGKELIARSLHGDRKGAFKAVNCADYLMSKGTARSELFGYVKGAFTGADRDRAGVFEEAQDGTVFLDEVYSLPPEAQVGLLRALQEKVITRIGSTKEIKIRCRIVAAAKPDLAQDIARDHFKADLYYRISQNILDIPALRERREDIAPLVKHFSQRWSEENSEKKEFLASAIPQLERYSWPGNVRELENVIYSILNTTLKATIGPEDLGQRFRGLAPMAYMGSVYPLRPLLEGIEKEHVLEVAAKCRTLTEAAKRLEISPQALLRIFEKHQLSSRKVIGSKLSRQERSKA